VDGDSFAHRAYHGLPRTIRRAGDKGGGAIVGFANTLLRLYEQERPRAVLVGWDTLEAQTYRNRAFPAYQAGRVFDDELLDQLRLLPAFVTSCGFANARGAGYEADDFLAAAAAREERKGSRSIVASGEGCVPARLRADHDLVSGTGRRDGQDRTGRGARALRRRSQAGPGLHRATWRPIGQAAGCARHRPKTAASLLLQARDLETLLASGRFAAQADDLRLFKRIATMDALAPLPPIRHQRPTWREAAELALSWGLASLSDRLAELAAKAESRPRAKAVCAPPLRIATFNINNVNRRLANLLGWLARAKPDVVCLQELKARTTAFPQVRSRLPGIGQCGAESGAGTASPSWRGTPNQS